MGYTISNLQQFVNLGIGAGEVAALRVDATSINAMGTDILRTIGKPTAHGDDAVDAGSGVGICIISIRSDSGRIGLVQVGDKIRIIAASGAEWIGTATIDDVISFNTNGVGADARLYAGVAPADYSNAGFIDGLRIFTEPLGRATYVHFDDLNLDEASFGGIHLGRFNLSTGANAETELVNATTDLYNIMAPGGGLLPSVVPNAAITPTAFVTESWDNGFDGGFEFDDDNDGLANDWVVFGAPLALSRVTPGIYGYWSQRVQTAPTTGIQRSFEYPYIIANFMGREVTFAIDVIATVNDTVFVEIDDGVGITTSPVGGVAGARTTLYVTRTIDAAPMVVIFRVYSDVATTFDCDGANWKYGRLPMLYKPSTPEIIKALSRDHNPKNVVPNGDFKSWTRGAAALPDWWVAGGMAPTAIARDAVNFRYGTYGFQMTLNVGESAYVDVPDYLILRRDAAIDQPNYLSFWYYGIANVVALDAIIDDGIMPPATYPFTPVVGTWQPLIIPVYSDITPLSRFRVTIQHTAAIAACQFVVDGFMVTNGLPAGFNCADFPVLKWDFVKPGAIAAAIMFHEGAQLDAFRVPSTCLVHRLWVQSITAPGAVVDTYTVQQNGAAGALAATVVGAATQGQNHLPGGVLFAEGDLIQVLMAPGGGSAAANIGVSVEGIRLGY